MIMERAKGGFTIVELLIVIVVIAILAAISVVVYAGIQNRAYDSAVQQDLRNIATKIEAYNAVYGQYPAGPSQLMSAEVTASKDAYGNHHMSGSSLYNLVYCRPMSGLNNDFALVARSKTGNAFQFTKQNGAAVYTGRWSGSTTLCTSAGVANDGSTPYRDWFFDSSAWQSFVK